MNRRLKTIVRQATTSWTEIPIRNAPLRLKIKRIRAELIAGSATQIAISVREVSDPTYAIDTPLEFNILGPSPIDSREDIYIETKPYPKNNSIKGNLYIAARTNTDDTDNDVKVYLDIEALP